MVDLLYPVTVTYVLTEGGEEQTYSGTFTGLSPALAVEAGRRFVLQYIRPSAITQTAVGQTS
jgi:hypothetical protein